MGAERDALAAALASAEADREARLAVILKQGADLGRLPALEADMAFVEASIGAARLAIIEHQSAELGDLSRSSRSGKPSWGLSSLPSRASAGFRGATGCKPSWVWRWPLRSAGLQRGYLRLPRLQCRVIGLKGRTLSESAPKRPSARSRAASCPTSSAALRDSPAE